MARRNPLLEQAISMLTQHGATDLRFEFGRHLKLRYRYRGQNLMAVIAISPSDHRATSNLTTQIKRQLREADERATNNAA